MRSVLCAALLVAAACAQSARSRAMSAPVHVHQPVIDGAPWPDSTLRWADVGKVCSTDSPAVVVSGARLDSVPMGTRRRISIDATFYDWSQRVPGGFGGAFFYDDTMYVFLVDTTKTTEAGAELARLDARLSGARVIKGRWTFAQIADWWGYLWLHDALRRAPLLSIDNDEGHNRLTIGVIDENARRVLEMRLAELGVPCNLVAIRIEEQARAMNRQRPTT